MQIGTVETHRDKRHLKKFYKFSHGRFDYVWHADNGQLRFGVNYHTAFFAENVFYVAYKRRIDGKLLFGKHAHTPDKRRPLHQLRNGNYKTGIVGRGNHFHTAHVGKTCVICHYYIGRLEILQHAVVNQLYLFRKISFSVKCRCHTQQKLACRHRFFSRQSHYSYY